MGKSKVVIFALVKNGKILLEKRPVPGFLEDQYLIPGGTIGETENLEQALERELKEELGIVPIEFELLIEEDILGLFENTLKPFIIKKWQGQIPKVILDKEDPYPLEWVDIEKALNIPIESTRRIIEALKKHLNDTHKT